MTAIRLTWLEDASANGHFMAVAQSPIREPGEIAPAEFLTLGFVVGEDLNVGRHGKGVLNGSLPAPSGGISGRLYRDL